jgi:hypothetical protein
MSKQDHLRVAEICFGLISKAESNKEFWEAYMYQALFAWAGWKE